MNRKATSTVVLHISLALATVLAPGGAPGAETAPAAASEELTVITSDKLTYDAEQRLVVFEGNVVVNDPSMRMTANHLTVHFREDNEVQSILATGNVILTQEDRRAWAQRAAYDVVTGMIVLEGEPRIMRGRDTMAGDRITFWRDEQRVICEPRATLVIHPGPGGVRDGLSGER